MIDNLNFDIGKGNWDVEEDGPWVTKTDAIQYKRCSYKVFLNYQQGIPYGEFLKPEFRNFFFADGIEFETEVVEEAIEEEELRLATSIKDIPSQDGLVRILSPIRNHELGCAGMPDMLMVENGRLMPVEVKNHSYVTRLDEIELAFYWRLLEPIQKGRKNRNRKGYVVLKGEEWREVPLNNDHFEQLSQLISEVRKTKLEDAQPKLVPDCDRCVFRDVHLPLILRAGDVSLVYEVRPQRRMQLEHMGITTIEQLAEAHTDNLVTRWRQFSKAPPGRSQIRKMQAHAKALLTYEPQFVGLDSVPELGNALILDLEYFVDYPGRVFVAGVLIVEQGKEFALHQEFADSLKDERQLLTSFADLMKSYSDHSIVTWYGSGADMPKLKDAWARLRLSKKFLRDMEQRHKDLFALVKETFRLPTLSLGLKDVASYFGYERAHADISSFLIPIKYGEFLATGNPALRQEILDHNADDLRSLLLTWSRLRDLSVSSN